MKPLRARLLAGLVPFIFVSAASSQGEKDVAAGPGDILSGRVRLPRPEAVGEWLADALWPAQNGVVDATFSTAGEGPLSIGVLTSDPGSANLFFGTADGASFELSALARADVVTRVGGALDPERSPLRYEVYRFPNIPTGSWSVRMLADSAPAWLVVRDAAPVRAHAYLSTLSTVSDRPPALLAELVEREGERMPLLSARAALKTDFGNLALTLRDDGMSEDGLAGDGLYGARLPYGMTGAVRAEIELQGAEVRRTVQVGLHLLQPDVVLGDTVTTRVADDRRLALSIEAKLARAKRVHLSAEVWGGNAEGELVPVAWLSRMLPEVPAGRAELELFLDGRWLAKARVDASSGGLELRHVRIQDPLTSVPWQMVERMPLAVGALPRSAMEPFAGLDDEMRMGSSGAIQSGVLAPQAEPPVATQRSLMITHGWCSSNIWPSAHFTAPKAFFVDPNANRSHDEFARLLRDFGAAQGLASYGIVGHSQGGNAALHLYTYYRSGLDSAVGPRLIQSVGSPYQGTPLATLGFFSCGTNNDLTTGGAATWLAGIPTWARQEVWYRTTSNSGSVCNFFSNLLLGSPNDGVVERSRGVLVGGNFVTHDLGWCHTTGMSNPSQYHDAAYNHLMDTQAAR